MLQVSQTSGVVQLWQFEEHVGVHVPLPNTYPISQLVHTVELEHPVQPVGHINEHDEPTKV